MDYILERAIVENIVSDNTAEGIKKHLLKGLKNDDKDEMLNWINLLLKKRNQTT